MNLNRIDSALNRAERNKLNENWQKIEQGIEEAKEVSNALLESEIDNAALQTDIQTKLNQLEEDYAPQLASVTAQLAEIAVTPWTDFFSSLDMRENIPLIIAQASDSTGDAANEYFELAWKKCFADIWKERQVRVKRWHDPGSGGSYQGWETWQTGVIPSYEKTDKVYADDFSTNSATIIGSLNPNVGSRYTEFATHGSYWSVANGKLVRGGSDDGTRATLRATLNSRSGKDFVFKGKVKVPTANANTSSEVFVVSDTEAVARIGINITGNGVATFGKFFNSTSTVLGTFLSATYNGVEVSFEISLYGTNFTAKLGGNTLTAELLQSEVDTLFTTTKIVVRSQIPLTEFDDFEVTSTVTVPEQPSILPTVDIYNGGAAGKTAEYQRANLSAMYPVRPDILFINHGHNYHPNYGWTIETMINSFQLFVDELNALHPSDKPIPIVITSQNPQFSSGREADHLVKMKALKAYADKKGWGYIPTFEAFAVRTDGGADQMQDALHPAVGTGRVLQSQIAEEWIKAHTKRPIS